MTTQTATFKNSLLVPNNKLKVTWFDRWHPALDEALASLPEMETCPHELFRLLLQTPGPLPKRTALVTEDGVPVAVVGLRQKGWRYYDLVTWIIPGALFPAKPGYLMPALEALGVEVWISWRRMENPPPPSRLIRHMKTTPVHEIRLADDFEAYWRETSHFRNIKTYRNRCRNFTSAVNTPGAAEWTIRNAEAKWRDNPTIESDYLSDWIVTVDYLESRGQHITLVLLDQKTPIGGATMMVHGNDLVGGFIYRHPEYDWYGVGVRLLDLVTSFAAESGYENFDFGGMYGYKHNWAPQVGELWLFNICPEHLYRAKQMINWGRKVRGKVIDWRRDGQAPAT